MTDTVSTNSDVYFSTDRAWQVLETIANTYAPGQCAAYTRALQIERLLGHYQTPNYRFDQNYRGTGNAVLITGEGQPKIWFFAHADEISYLVGRQQADGSLQLTPFCAHKSTIVGPAVVLRYAPESRGLEQVASGQIHPPSAKDGGYPRLTVTEGNARPGDRVVYAHQQVLNGDIVEGSIDDAAGVTACVLAAMALAEAHLDLPVGFVFTDEEEGPSEQQTSFSRGARRFLRYLDPAHLCVIVDGHAASGAFGLGAGALFAEKSGDAASAVTPPHLYAELRALAGQLESRGIRVNENLERVSRGDDAALIEATSNILLFGYPSTNRHYDTGPSAAALSDIVEVARLIYWSAIHFLENPVYER